MEGVDRRRCVARAVFHVVDGHAIDVTGFRQGRADVHAGHGNAGSGLDGGFDFATVVVKVFYQSVDKVVWARVGDILHDGGYINDCVAF